jgi:outer membrane protein assembly factor BamB
MRRSTLAAFAIVVVFSFRTLLAAENWPQWRGPLGTGVATAGDYPVKFSSTEGVAWKVDLPGKGTSTPAVWDDHIFLTCAIDGQDGLICYDTQGKELWRKQFGHERPGKHRNGSGSNPSPATDGKHVVAYYKSGTLACCDFAGKELWKTNLPERFGKDTLWWDLGTSPVVVDGCAVVAVEQSPRGQGERYGQSADDGGGERSHSYLVAFDLDSGDVKWRQLREYECAEESDQSYSTPQVVKSDGKDVIVTWGADHLTGHDGATGKLLWESGGFNPQSERAWRTIASLTVSDGVAVVPWGRGKFLSGVRIGGQGDVTKSNHLWDKNSGADVPTVAIRDGKIYLLEDTGKIVCLALNSGDELWSADLPRNRNKYYSSPVIAGDKLFCVREDGTVFVGQVSDTGYKQLAANEMSERIMATPVPIRGGLLIRGEEHLYWIGPSGVATTR